MKIRKADVMDVPAMTTLVAYLGYLNTEEALRSRYDAILASGGKVLVAQTNRTLLGLAALDCTRHSHRPPDGRLTALVVAAEYRHAGIDKRLLEAAEAVFLVWGRTRVELSSAGGRADAHRFCLREGYVETPKRLLKSLGDAIPGV
ncbi:GNAT family N-acetyltransferase [Noviherbaspirillum pedocola]|uniref:GNAT family N-acetyltransferase n=1 Tax=Noviherbaspirillum pedocola TaxID=2801341 RepID=A0A934SRX8_9BURK|nr:GNAT family N-acetyltransferase [Noviherbaspirillum pedocola]MBK4735646.1 GNAT family N-acetyltransferase [Noviherbaspirillum pedocola]